MATPLYILTSATPEAALMANKGARRAADSLRLAFGEVRRFEVFLLDAANNFDVRSGDSGHSIRVVVGTPGELPKSGGWTIGGSSELPWPCSIEQLQKALAAVIPGVSVNGSKGAFTIRWPEAGAQDLLECDVDGLFPQADFKVERITAGDASTREVQQVRLVRRPVAIQSTAERISNGWQLDLDLNNAGVAQLLAGAASAEALLEVEIEEIETGLRSKILRVPVVVVGDVAEGGTVPPVPFDTLATQAWASNALALKANAQDVESAVQALQDTKADADDVAFALDQKANVLDLTNAVVALQEVIDDNDSEVTAALATKADAAQTASALALLQAGQTSSWVTFATKADMDGNLAFAEGTRAEVMLDDDPENNGAYRKSGSSGSGSWVKSTNDLSGRVTNAETELQQLSAELEAMLEVHASGVETPGAGSAIGLHDSTRIDGTNPILVTGWITSLTCYTGGAGSMFLRVYSRSNNDFTFKRQAAFTSVVGTTTVSTWLRVDPGDYIGFYTAVGQINHQGGTGSLFVAAGDQQGTFTATPATAQLQYRVTISAVPDTSPREALEIIGGTDELSIVIRGATGTNAIRWVYKHHTSTHADIWEIYEAHLIERMSAFNYKVTMLGNGITSGGSRWEHAVQVAGDADFSGGSIHGWERATSVQFVIDGVPWTPTSENITCRKLTIYQRTNLFRWKADSGGSEDLIAVVNTVTEFTHEGVRLREWLEWQTALNLAVAYFAMVPVRRTIVGNLVTGFETRNNRTSVVNISTTGHTPQHTSNTTEVTMWGTAGVTVRWRALKVPSVASTLFISGSAAYNKLYQRLGFNGSVTPGEVWEGEYLISIDC